MEDRESTEYELLQRWSRLRRRARAERNTQKLITMLNRLDDLLKEIETVLANNERLEHAPDSDSNRGPSPIQKSGAN
jgi:hypothetical protein